MAKKRVHQKSIISNRRARFDFELSDTIVVGLVLTGQETKSLRLGHGQLRGSYVTVKDGELWLINAMIAGSSSIPIKDTEQTRARKILARKRQIHELIARKQQGLTIVPLEILTKGRYIKLRIATGKGKKKFDKRESLKKRDATRTMQGLVKRHLR